MDDQLALGTLEQIRQELRELRDAFTAADELGAIERIDHVAWAAAGVGEADYRGTFKTVAIYNKGGGNMRVAFQGVQGARSDADADFILRPFAHVVLPYRGSTLFYGGDVAGAASIFYLRTTQPFESGAA